MKIEFLIDSMANVPKEYFPYPASKNVPEWLKKTDRHIGGEKWFDPNGAGLSSTIKGCMPVLDSLTSGYIITTHADLWVTQTKSATDPNKTEPYFTWNLGPGISTQTKSQAPLHPQGDGVTYYPKILSPFGIKTPSGYSCLFVPPMNNPNGFFTVLPGIVDTDTYNLPVNFPFTLDDQNFTGIIPAGTPVAQVIPFKRDSWTHGVSEFDVKEKTTMSSKLAIKIFDKYKSLFWVKKEFK